MLLMLMAVCFAVKPKNILALLVLLLPVHGTIKMLLFQGEGEIFSFWKEFAILILLFRTRMSSPLLRSKIVPVFALLWMVVLVIYIALGLTDSLPFAPTLKQLLSPLLLMYAISRLPLSPGDIRRLAVCAVLGCVFINATAIIDFASPSLRMVFRTLMQTGFVVDANGNVYYDVSSFKIMNYDRACGLMMGGPNQLGVYNAALLFFCSAFWLCLGEGATRLQKRVMLTGTVVALFCLMVSFSRAGMALLIIMFGLFCFKAKSKLFYRAVVVLIACAGFVAVLATFVPMVSEVITATLTGKEASAAARGDMTLESLGYLIKHPLGAGLGAVHKTTLYNGVAGNVHFAESSLINFAVDIGVAGIGIFILLNIAIWKSLSRFRNSLAQLCAAGLMANLITSGVSVNPYETPYIYISWLFFALPFAYYNYTKYEAQKQNQQMLRARQGSSRMGI